MKNSLSNHKRVAFLFPLKNDYMGDLVIKILEDISRHLFVYFFILLAVVFGLILGRGVVGIVLFSLAIGILLGQEMHK